MWRPHEVNASIKTTLGTPMNTAKNYNVHIDRYLYIIDGKVTQCLKCRIDA